MHRSLSDIWWRLGQNKKISQNNSWIQLQLNTRVHDQDECWSSDPGCSFMTILLKH